jgi:ribosomal protein S18 acetylase RimI-like enzyme
LAVTRKHPIGITKAFVLDGHPETAAIVAMWVDPSYRRRGIGQALLYEITSWAMSRGLERFQLEVTETNAAAESLYRRSGFVPTGRTRPLPSNPQLEVIEMERPVSASE